MSDSCKCFDIEVEVILDEPKFDGELDFDGEVITCSDGEDYKRGYNEGHAQGLLDGQADGYKKGYDEGHTVGSESGYYQGKQDGLTEGYDNGYEKGKQDGYNDGYEQGYSEGYTKGYENGKAEGSDFIGIKYSDYDEGYPYMPHTADARSLEKHIVETLPNTSGNIATNLFDCGLANANYCIKSNLETIYMPSKLTALAYTFKNCTKLKTIIGDFSKVRSLTQSFYNCSSLTEIPDMPNLQTLSASAFQNCTSLTSFTFYTILKTWNTNAFLGCTNITEINLVDGWDTAVYAQHCEKLTQACLHDMCEKLAYMTGQNPLVFKIGEPNIAKIDDEHIAMLQRKNIDYS